MSKIVKGIKKGIKKVGKVIKKAAPYILMATAAYFTAGVALSYFPATASFSAALPGFGGAGIFTKAATAIGLSGPASAASAAGMGGAAAGAGALSGAPYAAAKTAMGQQAAMGAQATAASTLSSGASGAATTFGSSGGTKVASEIGRNAAGQMLKEGTKDATQEGIKQGMFSNMGVGDKLLLAKTVTDVASGLFADKPRDPNKYFWGYSRKGEGMDIIGDGRQLPARATQSPQQYYEAGTPEFMPEDQPRRTPADRQMEEYQTREQSTRPDNEDFI